MTAIQIGDRHWLVESATHPGEYYAVDDGECTCRSADCKKPCWHAKLIRQIEETYECLIGPDPTEEERAE